MSRPEPSSERAAERSASTPNQAFPPMGRRSCSRASPPTTPERGSASGPHRRTGATCCGWRGAAVTRSGRRPEIELPTSREHIRRRFGSSPRRGVRARHSYAKASCPLRLVARWPAHRVRGFDREACRRRHDDEEGAQTAEAATSVGPVEHRLVAGLAASAGGVAAAGPLEVSQRAVARPDQRREAAPRSRLLAKKWRGPDSNRRHPGFQPSALPAELPRRGWAAVSVAGHPPPRALASRP